MYRDRFFKYDINNLEELMLFRSCFLFENNIEI